jgi:hypothetical protein
MFTLILGGVIHFQVPSILESGLLIGMGGYFSGVSKIPLTPIVMVSEMTGSYQSLVPLMLACGLTMSLSRRWTLNEQQVPTPIEIFHGAGIIPRGFVRSGILITESSGHLLSSSFDPLRSSQSFVQLGELRNHRIGTKMSFDTNSPSLSEPAC